MGLVTAEEFKKARVLAETGVGDKESGEGEGAESAVGCGDGAARRKKKKKKKKLISTLSFGEEIEEADGDGEVDSGVCAKMPTSYEVCHYMTSCLVCTKLKCSCLRVFFRLFWRWGVFLFFFQVRFRSSFFCFFSLMGLVGGCWYFSLFFSRGIA